MYGGGDRWAAWMMVMVELACATRSLSRIWGGLDYAWPASGTRDKLSLSVLFAALLHNILFLLPLPSYAYSLAYFVAFLCAFYQLRWWIERRQHLHGSSQTQPLAGPWLSLDDCMRHWRLSRSWGVSVSPRWVIVVHGVLALILPWFFYAPPQPNIGMITGGGGATKSFQRWSGGPARLL